MAINFPNSPRPDNDTFTDAGTTWIYDLSNDTWTVVREPITETIPDDSVNRVKVDKAFIQGKRTAMVNEVPSNFWEDYTVTWDEAFADTNYTVVASIDSGGASTDEGLIVSGVSKSTTTCDITVINTTGSDLGGYYIHAIGIHD